MRRFARDNSEVLLIVALFALFGLLKVVFVNKLSLLNLYFIPVLLSGYFLGKRRAILSAVASVLLGVLFVVRWPEEIIESGGALNTGLNVLTWASLLVLTAILVSTLNEGRQRRQAAATMRILQKCITDIAKRGGHNSRVGTLSRAIAEEMNLSRRQAASIEAAGLLHDIADTEEGAELISDCGMLLAGTNNALADEVLPLLAKANSGAANSAESIPLGSRILMVADLYDEAFDASRSPEPLQIVRHVDSLLKNKDDRVISALSRVISRLATSRN